MGSPIDKPYPPLRPESIELQAMSAQQNSVCFHEPIHCIVHVFIIVAFNGVYMYYLYIFYWAIPALPICRISPVSCSSPLNTGQDAPSALTRFSSILVPRILKVDFSVSIEPYRGISAAYFFGTASVVVRSTFKALASNLTLAESLLIFLRNSEAMTAAGV